MSIAGGSSMPGAIIASLSLPRLWMHRGVNERPYFDTSVRW